ncbi:MAG: translocation/assembly module TamB domain-containing protein, partial [Rhodothermales bacterium]
MADLLGYRGMQGVVTGALILTGPAEAPNLSGSLSADLASFDQDVGDLRLTLDYRELRLNMNARLEHVDGSTLTARGYLPLDLRVTRFSDRGLVGGMIDESVRLTVVADSFNVGWIDPFLDPDVVSQFEGRLEGTFEVSGTVSQPIVDGSAQFVQGRIGLPELGITYHDIAATFVLSQNDVDVSDFQIRSGDGTLTGRGAINLTELTLGEFNVDLTARNFLAINSTEYEFVIEGDMVLSGTTKQPVIRGSLELVRGEILVTDETTSPELEIVQLTMADIQTVEQRFGLHIEEADTTTFSLYNALALDLDVRMERDLFLRSNVNPIMNIQFRGDIDLTKDHMQDVRVFGTIQVVPQHSSIVQFGKRFELTSGTLTFNGPPEDPYIDFAARYSVRTLPGSAESGVAITLSVRGRMSEELDLTLGSENPAGLDQTNILSYLATGRPASESLHLGGT